LTEGLWQGLKEPVRLPVDNLIEERERLLTGLAELRTPIGSRDYAIIAVFLLTGVRLGELTRLRVDQVALADGLVRVIGKGDKQREIPLIQRLALILRTYLTDARPRLLDGTDGPWLFVAGNGTRGGWRAKRPGEPMATRSIYRIVVARTEEILGRRIHPNVLRHSFASRLRSRGGDLQEVQQLLGHAEIGTTMRYSHITPTRKGRLEELLT
jgi:site-specific recombinase XerD